MGLERVIDEGYAIRVVYDENGIIRERIRINTNGEFEGMVHKFYNEKGVIIRSIDYDQNLDSVCKLDKKGRVITVTDNYIGCNYLDRQTFEYNENEDIVKVTYEYFIDGVLDEDQTKVTNQKWTYEDGSKTVSWDNGSEMGYDSHDNEIYYKPGPRLAKEIYTLKYDDLGRMISRTTKYRKRVTGRQKFEYFDDSNDIKSIHSEVCDSDKTVYVDKEYSREGICLMEHSYIPAVNTENDYQHVMCTSIPIQHDELGRITQYKEHVEYYNDTDILNDLPNTEVE